MTISDPKSIVRRALDEPFNHGNLASLDTLYDPGSVSHRPGTANTTDLEGTRQFVRAVRTAYPDALLTVKDLLSEGDLVAARWTFRGTNTGPFRNGAPTGVAIQVPGMTMVRLRAGRIVEEWVSWD
jgi:predicted ester cyclase